MKRSEELAQYIINSHKIVDKELKHDIISTIQQREKEVRARTINSCLSRVSAVLSRVDSTNGDILEAIRNMGDK